MTAGKSPILIWGAGAIGGTIGAYLARAGEEVHFADIVEDHVWRIDSDGLRIDGPVDVFTARAQAMLPGEVDGSYGRILLAVKAQHTAEATRALMPHLAPDGYVVSCQNGMNEPEIAAIVGAERTIGAFVNFGADWQGPGHVTFGGRGAVVIGELDGRITPRAEALLNTLQVFEPDALLSDNIFGYLWSKAAWGTVLKAEALTDETIVGFLTRPELTPLAAGLIRSVLRIALADGVTPMPFQKFRPEAFLAGDAEAATCLAEIAASRAGSTKLYSGVWRDIMVRRRKTEVPYQLAPVVAAGRRQGLPVATLEGLIERIRAAETGTPVTGIAIALELNDIARAEGLL